MPVRACFPGKDPAAGKKTPKQAADLKQAARKRGNLLEAARRGDTDAIETLTVEDMDLYSMVTRRIIKEDMYSIIETSFMPSALNATSIPLSEIS